MKTRHRMLWAGSALCALTLMTPATKPQAKSQEKPTNPALSKDEAALAQAEEAQGVKIRTRDVAGFMKYYAHRDDLTMYDTAGEDALVGWDTIRKHWEKQMDEILQVNRLELSKVRVRVVGDLGFLTATWKLEVTTREGEKVAQTGRVTDIWQKLDGKWLIVHEHNSIPFGDADNANRP